MFIFIFIARVDYYYIIVIQHSYVEKPKFLGRDLNTFTWFNKFKYIVNE